MPPPERQRTDHRSAAARRQRPGPTSALSPSPGPLMPVPDVDADGRAGARGGRRQHHRSGSTTEPADELVYLSGRVPRPLRDELHIRAIGEGRPVVDLLRDAIRGYLDTPSADR